MTIVAAVYDPQPIGSTSGPIRFVTSVPNEAALERIGLPYVVISGSSQGIGYSTHHVVDNAIQPLGEVSPPPLTVISPP